MSNRKISPLVMFDLVGTLTNAGPRYAEGFIRACRKWNIAPPEKCDIMARLGTRNLRQMVDELTSLPDDQAEAFMQDCNRIRDGLLTDPSWREELYDHVAEVIPALRQKGFLLGIFTASREDVRKVLGGHNILGHFDPRFVAGNSGPPSFIEPETIKTAQLERAKGIFCDAFNLAAQFVPPVRVIGGSVADYNAARKAGLAFTGFAPSEARKARLLAADPGMDIVDDHRHLVLRSQDNKTNSLRCMVRIV